MLEPVINCIYQADPILGCMKQGGSANTLGICCIQESFLNRRRESVKPLIAAKIIINLFFISKYLYFFTKTSR